MHLNIFVSPKCFCYCSGCYSLSRQESCKNPLSSKIIVKFLKYAFANGIYKVTLCGGDPLTRNDILSLLKKIKKIGFYISIDTMGTTIVRNAKIGNYTFKKIDVDKLVEYVDMIGIPIDGTDDKTINYFRNSFTGVYNEQLLICDVLHSKGANLCINTVLNKGNVNEIEKLTVLINNLQYIKKWQFFEFVPSGIVALANRSKFELDKGEFSKCQSYIIDNCTNENLKLEFKTISSRNSLYMLIDNSGYAWIFSENNNKKNDRKIIGNIKNKNDWEKICLYLKREEKG